MKKIYLFITVLACIHTVGLRAQCSTAATLPYYENFESITQTYELPLCWSTSSPSMACLTFTSGGAFMGNKYAAFFYSPSGTHYFYSKFMHLKAGVTYSASMFYRTTGNGSTVCWTNLRLMLGQTQSAVALSTIAAVPGNVIQPMYSSLSNTFTVSSTGDYCLAVSVNGWSGGSDPYLYFDEVSVTVPCNIGNNTPAVVLSADAYTVCSGSSVQFTLSGADTYSVNGVPLSTSSGTAVYTQTLNFSSNFQVVGTSTLSGCANTLNPLFSVNPTPMVFAFTNQSEICAGGSAVLNGVGASAYIWSPVQASVQTVTVSPSVSTVYTLTGIAGNGCEATATTQILVNPLPSFTITTAPASLFCFGQPISMSVSPGLTYQWYASDGGVLAGDAVVVTHTASTLYTVIGTDQNGCKKTQQLSLSITICDTGLPLDAEEEAQVVVYPNPCGDELGIRAAVGQLRELEIWDLYGRLLKREELSNKDQTVSLSGIPQGIYLIRVRDAERSQVLRVVKEK